MPVFSRWDVGQPVPPCLRKLHVAFLLQLCIAAAQPHPGAACNSGQADLGSRPLDTLSPQQLADGALAGSVLATWDFQGRAGVLTATPGKAVTLSCVTAANATVAQPGGPPGILQPTAIDLAGAAGLVMRGVSLTTDCATVLSYQQYFCTTYRVAGSLQLERGAVHFNSWQDGFTSLDNVTLTCPSPEAAAQPPCRLAAVQTAQQLLEAFTGYAAAAAASGSANVTIVIANNISIPASGFWPPTPVVVTNNVTMLGSPLLGRPILDLGLNVKMWDLVQPYFVQMVNLTAVNLAPSYFSPGIIFSQFGMLSERVWAFRRYQRLLYIINCTLVVPPEQLAYTTYWLTFLVSPVPEAQAKAAWIRVGGAKVAAVNQSGVFYESAVAYTVIYSNVLVTDTLGDGYPLMRQDTGLAQLLDESVPLTSCNPAINASDLRLALDPKNSSPDAGGRRWVLLVANLSVVENDSWTGAGSGAASSDATGGVGAGAGAVLTLPGSTLITRGPGLAPYRLSFAGRTGALVVPTGSTLTFRHLIMSALAGSSPSYAPADPLAVLSSPLWGVGLAAGGGSRARLENCSVLLSADELRLLQAALLRPNQAASLPAPSRPLDARLLAEVAAFFSYSAADPPVVSSYGPSYLAVDTGATRRYAMYGVTFRTAVAADGEVAAAGFSALGVPFGGGGTGRRGLAGRAMGVIVGCVVGGAVLLLLTFAAVLLARRRRCGPNGDVSGLCGLAKAAADGGPSAAAAAAAAAGAPPSGFMDQSHELTSSSRVMRPGARDSDAERYAAVAALPLKLPSGNTESGGGDGAELRIMLDAALTGGGASGSGGGSSVQVSYAAVTAAGAARLAQAAAAAAADSFDLPPTCSMLGQHGAATGSGQGMGLSQRAAAALPPAGSASDSGAATPALTSGEGTGTGSALRSQGGGGLGNPGGSGSPAPASTGGGGVSAGSGGSALDQMRAMIHILGRDFNDRQLEVHGMLGKGAHGTVYKGRWRGLPVAIKSMICPSDSTARQQQRPLMEAAISSNLMHPNIVTTYSYELREVEHEMASLSPELARQGGGWRLLIIQEYCDAGPLRRVIDCGFFLTPKPSTATRPPPQQQQQQSQPAGANAPPGRVTAGPAGGAAQPVMGAAQQPAEGTRTGGTGGAAGASGAGYSAAPPDPCSSSSGGGAVPGAPELAPGVGAGVAELPPKPLKPALDEVPADVPPRPGSSREAVLRYVEAALMIARGLQHIHDKNIVHGDLNPNNVLLMRSPGSHLGLCLKVADFGLSIRMAEGESHMSNLFQGSPYYCAPEVVLSGKVGKSADIYSLGIMLWELQNGSRPPWRMGVRLRTFPSLNTAELEFGPDTPPRYARLARDCFHGSKDARPHIGSVVDQLAALQAELMAAPSQRGA